jgi:hypothetical protein
MSAGQGSRPAAQQKPIHAASLTVRRHRGHRARLKYLCANVVSTKNCNRSPDEVGWPMGFPPRCDQIDVGTSGSITLVVQLDV